MSIYYYTELTLTMLDADVLPVGRHKWLVENNVCNEGMTSSEELMISGCDDGQFTCDDGKCLEISQRCNNVEVIMNYQDISYFNACRIVMTLAMKKAAGLYMWTLKST